MPVMSVAAFARRWRALSAAERAAFAADLWSASGHETRVDGEVVMIESGPSGPGRLDCSRQDGVLVRSEDRDEPRLVEAAALRSRLLYAVERGRAEALSEAYFDRPLSTEDQGWGGSAGVLGLPRRRLAVGAVALFVMIAVAVVTGGLPTVESSLGAGAPEVAGDAVPTVVTTDRATPDTADQPQGGGDLFRYPPGLGPNGVTDVDELAAAHRSTLGGNAWEMRLELNRSHDVVHPFLTWRAAEQTVVRASHTEYRYAVTGRTRLENGSTGHVSYVDYGDGQANYRRIIGLHGSAYERTRLPTTEPPGVFAEVSAAYVGRYLSTTESRVEPARVDNTTRTRVVATGNPTAIARTVANYTAVAVVDRRGVVRSLTVEYTLLRRVPDPTPNGVATPYASPGDVETEVVGTVRFRMVWGEREPGPLAPPGWYGVAVTATNGTDLGLWPNDPAV